MLQNGYCQSADSLPHSTSQTLWTPNTLCLLYQVLVALKDDYSLTRIFMFWIATTYFFRNTLAHSHRHLSLFTMSPTARHCWQTHTTLPRRLHATFSTGKMERPGIGSTMSTIKPWVIIFTWARKLTNEARKVADDRKDSRGTQQDSYDVCSSTRQSYQISLTSIVFSTWTVAIKQRLITSSLWPSH